MTANQIAATASGTVLVLLILTDVFRSVVLPRASRRALRLVPWIAIGLMRGTLRLTRHEPAAQRHNRLAALGPLLIVIEMVIWVAMLIIGFGLMMHGLRGSLKGGTTFGDSLYAAASIFLTLGLPRGYDAFGTARLVVAMCALSGLAVVTLTVTFLLAIQGALAQREVLVLRLRARTGPNPSGLAILAAHARLSDERDATLLEFFQSWEAWSAGVLLTHRAFPILCYFRSTDPDCEWLAALGATLDAASLVAALTTGGLSEHATLCHRVGARLVADLARQFRLTPRWQAGVDEAAFRRAEASFQRATLVRAPISPRAGSGSARCVRDTNRRSPGYANVSRSFPRNGRQDQRKAVRADAVAQRRACSTECSVKSCGRRRGGPLPAGNTR